MNNLLQDFRYGLRLLLKRPVFTLVVALSLALGIGPCASVFDLIRSSVLAPLPVHEPDRLLSLYTTDTKNPGNLPTSYPNFEDFRKNTDVFSDMLASTYAYLSWDNGDSAQEIIANVVSGNYFDVLGVKPALGRTFAPEEDKTPGTHPVVVISHGFWQRALGGDANVVGKTLTLNRHQFTVIGVAPKAFAGTDLGGGADLWVPMMMRDVVQPGFGFYQLRRGLFLFPVGRLKPGVGLEQAAQAMGLLARQLEAEYPTDNEGRGVRLIPLKQARLDPDGTGRVALVSWLMVAMVGIVLLTACVNVASLMLARALARGKEIAVRMALGVSRARLVRQLFVESLMLTLLGGALGLLLAYGLNRFLGSLNVFAAGPNQAPPHISGPVLLFTLAVMLLCGLFFGLVPALQTSKVDMVLTLKGEPAASVGRGPRGNLRKALVVFQIALSIVSLVGAGLLVRSMRKTLEIDPGFHTDNVLVLGLNLAREGYSTAQVRSFYPLLTERVGSLPGVQAVSVARDRPFTPGLQRSVFAEGEEAQAGGRGTLVKVNHVGPNFFETLGIGVLRGRALDGRDAENAPKAAVVNETAAARFWPGQEAVGRRFKFFGEQEFREVVGVVKDTKYNSLVEERRPFIYLPLQQNPSGIVTLYVRTAGDPAGLGPTLREQIRALEPRLPILNLETLRRRVELSLDGQRKTALLLPVFSGLALLLTAVGIYGVMSYMVAQRTREIGIRMALGAQRHNAVLLILRQATLLLLLGISLGLSAAFVGMRLLTGTLSGIAPTDPSTYGVASLLMAVVALLASYFPAQRAAKVAPLIALRTE